MEGEKEKGKEVVPQEVCEKLSGRQQSVCLPSGATTI